MVLRPSVAGKRATDFGADKKKGVDSNSCINISFDLNGGAVTRSPFRPSQKEVIGQMAKRKAKRKTTKRKAKRKTKRKAAKRKK